MPTLRVNSGTDIITVDPTRRSFLSTAYGATPGVQARHSRGLRLAWPRHQRTARGLAAGEAEGSQGVGKAAGRQRSGQRGDIHADAATRHDDSRRGHAAHQFRSLGGALISDPAAWSLARPEQFKVGERDVNARSS